MTTKRVTLDRQPWAETFGYPAEGGGEWLLRNLDTGQTFTYTGDLALLMPLLPEGRWELIPPPET